MRKLRRSRIYDVQNFKLYKPLPKLTAHRADKALPRIKATEAAVVEDGSQFQRAPLIVEVAG